MDEDSYEKDVLFYLEISNPVPLDGEEGRIKTYPKNAMDRGSKILSFLFRP